MDSFKRSGIVKTSLGQTDKPWMLCILRLILSLKNKTTAFCRVMIILNDYSPFYYSFVALSVTPENKRETSETQ